MYASSTVSFVNWSTGLGSITFDNDQQRSFIYGFIGRQCNGNWTILKVINPTFLNFDNNLCTYMTYPTFDTVIGEDAGSSCYFE
jgi:hypothetical protein